MSDQPSVKRTDSGALPIFIRHDMHRVVGMAEFTDDGAFHMRFREPVPINVLLDAGFGVRVVQGETLPDGSIWVMVAHIVEWSLDAAVSRVEREP